MFTYPKTQVRILIYNFVTVRNYNFYPNFGSNLKLVASQSNNVSPKRFSQTICWKCGKETKSVDFFCDKCNVIQNPQETENYFKLFNIDEKFDIDQQTLKTTFRKLQNAVHPDRFTARTTKEKEISAEYSSLLNKAYNNLQTPLKRAEHLLKLKGQNISEDSKIDDPEFLMEMMELNEEVENAKTSDVLKQLNKKNKIEIEKMSLQLEKYFEQNNLGKAKEEIVKLKYYISLDRRINALLRELGIVD